MTGDDCDQRGVSVDFAGQHLDRVLEFFPRAESKVAYVSGLSIGMLAVLVGNLPTYSKLDAWCAVSIPAVLVVMYALRKCYESLRPSLNGGTGSLIYFRSIATLTESTFTSGYCGLSERDAMQQICEQIWRNAKILDEKFKRIDEAFRLLIVAVPLWLIALTVLIVRHGNSESLLKIGGA